MSQTIFISDDPRDGGRMVALGEYNEKFVTTDCAVAPVIYKTTAEEMRRKKIAHSRNWFLFLVAVLIGISAAFWATGLPYQPFVAVLIATVGIVVVLAMKSVGK
jgi:hypothetical protein